MYYTIYKITNQIDGKFYIGSHKTKDLDDNYMGSGKYLIHAQKKYGIENFKKEILFVFETAEEMYAKEAELVNEDFLATENTYNLKIGGFGGFDYLNDPGKFNNVTHSSDHGRRMGLRYKERLETDPTFRQYDSDKKSDRMKFRWENGDSRLLSDQTHMKKMALKAQSAEAKEKRKRTMKETEFQKGAKNSQFGTCWIWHELIGNKKITKDMLPLYIEQGWLKTYKPGYRV